MLLGVLGRAEVLHSQIMASVATKSMFSAVAGVTGRRVVVRSLVARVKFIEYRTGAGNALGQRKSAVNQRGREKKGPRDIAPKSFSPKLPKWCSVLFIAFIGKSALEIGQFLRRNFCVISGVVVRSSVARVKFIQCRTGVWKCLRSEKTKGGELRGGENIP